MAKITPKAKPNGRDTLLVKTQMGRGFEGPKKWWKLEDKTQRGLALIDTFTYLKEQLTYRYRQTSLYARLYSNISLFGPAGSSLTKIETTNRNLPLDRPTMNVVQSCIDTLVSRITQSRPRPIFLTDKGDYKMRNLAKQLNSFVMGEFYYSKAYRHGADILRDAAALGTGCLKVVEDQNKRVCVERRLFTELFIDPNDGLYGSPRQLYEMKLVDRDVLLEMYPKLETTIMRAEAAYVDGSQDYNRSIADQIMVVEGWHLPSGPDAKDGKHMISISSGPLVDEEWTKQYFPFVFLTYTPRLLGFWGQSLTEQLMGTQIEINKLLMTISRAINLVGVPRVFVEDGSKVVKAHFNNEVGSIITYRGVKPQYEVAPCVPEEVYAQLQRLVDYAYQQSGISSLAAASQKPAGLDSGVALREYDDLQTDRFASLAKRYDEFYVDLAYQVIDLAKDIAERDGKYSSVYPTKNGTQQVDLPKASLLDDTYIIQCFDASSLPRDPAGRLAKVTEMIQSGMISIQEGRRMLDYPDLEQNEQLANASEERILKILDEIVEDGKYTPPDPVMNLDLAKQLSNQYYNLYTQTNLEPEKAQQLLDFNTQAIALEQAAIVPQMAPQGPIPGAPGVPQPLPQADLMPQVPQTGT